MELWVGYGLEGRKGCFYDTRGSKYMAGLGRNIAVSYRFTRLTIRRKDFTLTDTFCFLSINYSCDFRCKTILPFPPISF